MKPGDLVRSTVPLDLCPTLQSVAGISHFSVIPRGSQGILLSSIQPHAGGTWVQWLVGGEVGWSASRFLEVISEDR